MISVACAIIFNNGKILATQRSESMKMPLKWEFPGGKVEAYETAQQCIVREIKEELNIDIQVVRSLPSYTYNYGHFSIRLFPFVCEHVSGQLQLHEHLGHLWLNLADLPALDWAEADVALVELLVHKGIDIWNRATPDRH